MMSEIRRNRRTASGPVTKKERIIQNKIIKDEELKNNITLDYFFENHFKQFVLRKLKPKSAQTELSHYYIWIKNKIGDEIITNIDSSSWDKVIAGFNSKNLTDRTKIYICGTLCRILRLAKERKYKVDIPLIKNIGLSQSENRRLRVISHDEIKEIFNELKKLNINAYNITLFALCTGCRFSEAASLKWTDVSDDYIIFRETKNKTIRKIPISEIIKNHLSNIQKNSEYVFVNSRGKKYNEPPSSFMTIIDKLGLNNNRDRYNRITFHSLRHTAATYMSKILELLSLMDIFGWKVPTMAARYMHGDEESKKNALNMIGNIANATQIRNIIE